MSIRFSYEDEMLISRAKIAGKSVGAFVRQHLHCYLCWESFNEDSDVCLWKEEIGQANTPSLKVKAYVHRPCKEKEYKRIKALETAATPGNSVSGFV